MRQLKYHEKKLLKKVDLLEWKQGKNTREIKVIRRYLIQNRDDYHKYNKVVGLVSKLVARIKKRKQDDPFRIKITEDLLNKLYDLGVITTKSSMAKAEQLTVSAFCRYVPCKEISPQNHLGIHVY